VYQLTLIGNANVTHTSDDLVQLLALLAQVPREAYDYVRLSQTWLRSPSKARPPLQEDYPCTS